MGKILLPLLAVLGGMAVSIQSAVNSRLGKTVGTIEASFVSFVIGTIALAILMPILGKGNVLLASGVPKWQLVGGLLGAFYVFILVFLVPQLGVTTTIVAVMAGQILISAIIDHFGWFGGRQVSFGFDRSIGTILLMAAIYMFFRNS
ncbi:DMT family transporter [Bacillus sp. EB01]|uniref:DMT family transporter n=1 Tax=Bacillus sp. EB01 TaxID=1347086 RepID=UPI000A8E0275|nr:DMT family transporter [Bacillus sp. EB01]